MARLMLKAVLHNWGMLCAYDGSWLTVTWKIFDNGSYRIDEESFHIPEAHDRHELVDRRDHVLSKGRMDPETFEKLLSALDRDPWRDPEIVSDGCDGVAWEINQYANGKVIRSSGKPGYIYGQKNLERIVSLLPATVGHYGVSAYISVKGRRNSRHMVE